MNEDTLWLQVPAAKRQPTGFIGLATDNEDKADKLEQVANRLMSLQSSENLSINKTTIILFAADHGFVTANENSSLQPLSGKQLKTFSATSDKNHTINKILNTQLEIINLGTKIKAESIKGITNSKIDSGTANFFHAPAMNSEKLARAINTGRQSAQRIKLSGAQLFVASEINNANTLSALVMTCALLDIEVECLSETDAEQKQLIRQALIKHKENLTSPLEILRHLGSFEIAALTGSYLCCAHMGLPVLIDGFASAVAALVVTRLCPAAEQWFLYSTTPANGAHKLVFKTLKAQALLQTKQPLDNIAGITMALSLLQLACHNHNEMRRFSEENLRKRYS